MVQAARSGVQNIAEGSMASATSKKTELKLTNVARASLEELRLDYEDFLRQRGLPLWERSDRRRAQLISQRPKSADEVAEWAREVKRRNGQHGPGGQSGQNQPEKVRPSSTQSIQSTKSIASPSYPEIAANGALTLIEVASSLLGRQISSLERAFLQEGGFTERLYKSRIAVRNDPRKNRR